MWKFQEVLNQDIAILLVMAFGALSVVRSFIFKKEDMRIFNVFLFRFTLPMSVIMGLGIKTDLYDATIWRFVGAFLMMRAIMLLACGAWFGSVLRQSLGDVTANWLSTTWISTVILGVPLLKALLGPQYANLGVVAGISSFIFQLPCMLILFEVHTWRQENRRVLPQTAGQSRAPAPAPGADADESHSDGEAAEAGTSNGQDSLGKGAEDDSPRRPHSARVAPAMVLSAADAAGAPGTAVNKLAGRSTMQRMGDQVLGCLHFKMTRTQGKRLGLRLVLNHVLWGVGIGIVLSLSTLGPTYLDPCSPHAKPNCDYAVGAGFIYLFLEYFARCTEPVAFFATGMWMIRKNPVACGWLQAALYMLVKLILVPALMMACCFAVGLEGAYARAAVLVATLPVSAAAFALSKTYGVGEDVAVANVFFGNLLVLPTTIAWLEFMDTVGLFTVPTVKLPSVC